MDLGQGGDQAGSHSLGPGAETLCVPSSQDMEAASVHL